MYFFEEDMEAYVKYVNKNFPNSPMKDQNELKKPLKRLFKDIKIIRLLSRLDIYSDRQAIFDDLLQSIFDLLFSLGAYSVFHFNAALRSVSEQIMIVVIGFENADSTLSNSELSKKRHSDLWQNYIKPSELYGEVEAKESLDNINDMFSRGSQILHRGPNIDEKNNFDFLNEYFDKIENKKILNIVRRVNYVDTAVQVLIFDRYLKSIDFNNLTMSQKYEYDEIVQAIEILK
ncbi:hypothetical protein [Leuconostoc lactis]|uniref:hypothetical protein n=1 Tax=Leuconostoc lactis TaxID=1246 RepID=UPI001021FB35|nr:hypothetical protein [Leuconostoc lactis]MSB65780.1 hypothetical protein [Leuconostoc lactis]RYS91485.1 hypothetical protein EAI73_00645 [Leuconostoc lactis]